MLRGRRDKKRKVGNLSVQKSVMMGVTSACKESKMGMDNGKYVRYTPEQVEALERVYHECPKPSSLRRQQLIRECPILSNIDPKQIKVWFQNRRCREKQRKEASRLQTVNRKKMIGCRSKYLSWCMRTAISANKLRTQTLPPQTRVVNRW
ncbi:hypothetical protein CsSME_00044187 [Camellia sinensis var. sinensis]